MAKQPAQAKPKQPAQAGEVMSLPELKALLEASHKKHERADLAGLDLSGLDLTKMDMHGADCTRTNFTDCKMHKVNLQGATLTGAQGDLTEADTRWSVNEA